MNRSPEQMNIRLQILENKSKQCSVLLRSAEISDAEKSRITQKQRHVNSRIAAVKCKLTLNENKKDVEKGGNEMKAASRIQRAMRRFRFMRLKSRTRELDQKLSRKDLNDNDRALLNAKRMIVVERIKNLGQRTRQHEGRREMLQAKFQKLSVLIASPNISDARRMKLTARLHRISMKLSCANSHGRGGCSRPSLEDYSCGGRLHGKGGKGHCGKGKGKGHMGKGHHGKGGKGCFDLGANKEWGFEMKHHSKGKGKGRHGKGCGKGKGQFFDEPFDWEEYVDVESFPDMESLPVAQPAKPDAELDLAFALSMEDVDDDSDESDSDEEA